MAGLKLKSPAWTLLVGFPVFLTQLIPKTLSVDPGSPLSKDEYVSFFNSLKPKWKAALACQIRHSKGCHDPKIMKLDQLENNGHIPDGPICADLPENIHFDTFCLFAQFRCLTQKYYMKRIACQTVQPTEQVVTPSPVSNKIGVHDSTLAEVGALPEIRLRSNVDAILKYAFAVSGEEPVPKSPTSTPDSNEETFATTAEEEPTEQQPTEQKTAEQKPAKQKPTKQKPAKNVAVELHILGTTKKPTTDIKGTEELTDKQLHQSIHRLIGKEFALEKSLKAKDVHDAKKMNVDLNDTEENTENGPNGSIFDLDKDGALVILCYSILQDICISSPISKAWKQLEDKTLGFGASVCDNFGRHHEDLCSECAFCSLKTEQCEGVINLKRVQCLSGNFTDYINPGILAEHQATVTKVSSSLTEFYGLEMYEGLQSEYWCDRLATHGCDDYRVALWLQSEYSLFRKGDLPEKICDSENILHPTYCAFKSNQCREYSVNKKKVTRIICKTDLRYHVLSKDEGKEEVMLWKEKFLTFSEG